MNCGDARAAFLSGGTSQAELDHLAGCAECKSEWEALDGARRVLEEPAFWEEPSLELKQRVVAMISSPAAPAALRRPRRQWAAAAAVTVAAALVAFTAWGALGGAAPDWEVALPGTAEAPVAQGVVKGWNEPGGTRLALDIDGLPAAPAGSVYEFWFTRDEIHISAGTFVSPDDVELWVGVKRIDYPRLWITLEPLDEDESPSGINVMDTG